MTDYLMTPAQEQEMREVARQMLLSQPNAPLEAVIFRLSSFVFKDGRLSDTVPLDKRRQLAKIEDDLRQLELHVVRSKYRELHLWKDESHFMVGKGTVASTERWYLFTPLDDYYGDTIAEVFDKAESKGYPEIYMWCAEFNER